MHLGRPQSLTQKKSCFFTSGCDREAELADAGLTDVDGVRRSTRVKFKPLKWWDGERKVYSHEESSSTSLRLSVFSAPWELQMQALVLLMVARVKPE
jgi:hypothetical protein